MARQRYRKKNRQPVVSQLPEPGTQAWEDMADFMRADLENDMAYSKIIDQGRKIVEARGENFEEAFEEWKKENGHE